MKKIKNHIKNNEEKEKKSMKNKDKMNKKLKYKEYEPNTNRKLLLDEYGEVHIEGKITKKKGKKIFNDIRYLEKLHKENKERNTINVCINSSGGDVRTCLNIFYELKYASSNLGMKVCTKNFGSANGYAGIVFLAGDERLMMYYSEFVLTGANILEKPIKTLRKYKDADERITSFRKNIKNIVTKITNINYIEFDRYMNRTEKYFDYENAIKKEIATGLLKDCSKDKKYSCSTDIIIENLDEIQSCKSVDTKGSSMKDYMNLDMRKK